MISRIRNSYVFGLLQDAIAPLFCGRPVEEWPGLFGKLHNIRVPKSIRPLPSPSPSGSANTKIILDLFRRVEGLQGDLAECGVWVGSTLVPLAVFLKQNGHRKKKIHGFDSFRGFEEQSIRNDLLLGGEDDPNKRVGGFSNTSLEIVRKKLERFGVLDFVQLYDGFFQETLSKARDHSFSFVHLDCDIYDSYRECLEFFYPRMVSGGIVLFDEYNDPPWPGCNKAVDEFLKDKPEKLESAEAHNQIKYYFVKK